MNRVRALLLACSILWCLAAHAQDKDKEGFVPVAPGENLAGETLPGNRLLGIAYGTILVALIVWIASVAARARRVEEELAALRGRIDKKG